MLIITRMLIDPHEVLKQNISDVYQLHKLVYAMFPKSSNGRDFLFSYDFYPKGGCKIEVLSKRRPITPSIGRLMSREVPKSFWEYKKYRFEIWANPVMRKAKDRSIVPLKKEETAISWLIRSMNRVGLKVKKDWVEIIGKRNFKFNKNGQDCTIWGVKFRGRLEKEDNVRLDNVVIKGIGRAKAFGFGLLKLVPVKEATERREKW